MKNIALYSIIAFLYLIDGVMSYRTPLSQQSDWFNKGLIRVSAHDAAKAGEVSSPFFSGILPGVTAEEVGAVIYDLMTMEIREIAASGNPDATELLEAMLLTSIDASGLGTPAVRIR